MISVFFLSNHETRTWSSYSTNACDWCKATHVLTIYQALRTHKKHFVWLPAEFFTSLPPLRRSAVSRHFLTPISSHRPQSQRRSVGPLLEALLLSQNWTNQPKHRLLIKTFFKLKTWNLQNNFSLIQFLSSILNIYSKVSYLLMNVIQTKVQFLYFYVKQHY